MAWPQGRLVVVTFWYFQSLAGLCGLRMSTLALDSVSFNHFLACVTYCSVPGLTRAGTAVFAVIVAGAVVADGNL